MGWMQIGVTTSIEWPLSETAICYQDYQFILRPPKGLLYGPDILLEYQGDCHLQAHKLILEFMSVLAWLKNQPIEVRLPGWNTGKEPPGQTGPGPQIQNVTDVFRIEVFPDTTHPKARTALALYREAIGTKSTPFRYLGLWKLASLVTNDGSDAQLRLFERAVSRLQNMEALNRLADLQAHCGSFREVYQRHLYGSRRCAIAHATSGDVINPDDPVALNAINDDLVVLHEIAKLIMQEELNIKTEVQLYSEIGKVPPEASNKALFLSLAQQMITWQTAPGPDKET